MKKLLRLKTMLLLCALIAGGSSVWADADVTYDFTGSDWKVSNGTLSNGIVSFTGAGGANFKMNSGYFMMGKSGAYLNFPTYTSAVEKIVVTGRSGASTSVGQNIYVENVAVSAATTGAASANTYEIDSDYQAAGTQYTLKVTTAHNTQITKIEVYFASSSDPTAPSATLSESSLGFGEVIFGQTKSKTFTVTPANLTSDLTIAWDNANYEVTPTTIASTATTAQTITVTAKPTALNDFMEGTITISGGGLASNKTVTLATTVVAREAVQPEGGAGGGYTLVTDASTLADGDIIILVNEDYGKAISAQSGNYRSVVDVTITNHAITSVPATVATLTLEGSEDAWYFQASDGYLYASSKSSNNMGTETNKDDNAKATISIDEDGKATIEFQGSNTHNNIRYNDNGGSNQRFSCYASTSPVSDMPMIYRQNVATSFDITIGDAKWRTLVSSKNVTLPEGLAAYIVTASSASSATLTAISKVKANTAVLLNGNAGDYTLTVTEDDVTYDDTNLLQVSTESTGNGVYVLADKDGVGFYKWTGGSLGAGRVYLPAPAAAAREFLSFDFGETTGINNVESSKLDVEGFYNLAGQRVAQPTKGLYIVNGRKVVIR